MKYNLLALLVLTVSFGFGEAAEVAKPDSIDFATLDRGVKPCDDFYGFACGGWIKRSSIPDDKPDWSRGFSEIADRNEKILKEILEGYAKGKLDPQLKEAKILGDFFASCMDETRVERDSLKDLRKKLTLIDGITNAASLAKVLGSLHLMGVDAFFSTGATQDLKDSNQMILGVDQGGLSLPDRDYYLKSDGKIPAVRKLFREHLTKMWVLLGETSKNAKKYGNTIFEIETLLAKAALSREELRDPQKLYHRLDRAGLISQAPSFPWDDYFASLGYPQIKSINVSVPSFIGEFNRYLTQGDYSAIRVYLKWHLYSEMGSTLGKRFVEERFRFRSAAFSGEKKLRIRWKRCVSATESAMGETLGHAFVNRTFGEDGKVKAKEMIARIEDAFEKTLQNVTWFDEPTRKTAIKKLKAVHNQIGYPDKWRDFSKLAVGRDSYLNNVIAAEIFNSQYDLDKIGKPVDRTEWEMAAHSVNAYYSPENNKIVFPAGILQPPFFSKVFTVPLNYGAIGMVMGHELTHGFDDEGCQFDERGNLQNWWSKSVEGEFEKHTVCLEKQYENYIPVDKLHLNGKLTLGENIADQGGIRLAYAAMQAASQDEVSAAKAEFSKGQTFFIGFAQSWCTKQRPELQRLYVTVDPHSPPKFRVNGPLSNFPKFAEEFGCKAGSSMVNPAPCSVW